MDAATTQQRVVWAPHLRPLPIAAEAALRILSVGELDASTLALVIGSDPAMTAAIIRATEPCEPTRSVADRIAMLTPARLQSALFPMLSEAFGDVSVDHTEQGRWQQALSTAVAAECVARATGWSSSEQAYLAGLLQHCGIISVESDQISPETLRSIARTYKFPQWLQASACCGPPRYTASDAGDELAKVLQIAAQLARENSGMPRESAAGALPLPDEIGIEEARAAYTISISRRLSLFGFAPSAPQELRTSLLRFANQLLLNWRVDESVAGQARERANQLEALNRFHVSVYRENTVQEAALSFAISLRAALRAETGALTTWCGVSTNTHAFSWHGLTAPITPEDISDDSARNFKALLELSVWHSVASTAPCVLPIRTPANRVCGYLAVATSDIQPADWLGQLESWARALGAAIERIEDSEQQALRADALRAAMQHAEVSVHESQPSTPATPDIGLHRQRNLARAVVSALNVPLNAISAGANQLVSSPVNSVGNIADDLARHARTASRALSDIQALSCSDPGAKEAILVNTPLRQFLQGVRGRLERRAISLEEDLADGLPRIKADQRKLHNVLSSLFSFLEMRMGHNDRQIAVRSSATDDRIGVRIGIEVSGLALSEKQTEHLFDPLDDYDVSGTEYALSLAACAATLREFGGIISAVPSGSGILIELAFETVGGHTAPEPVVAPPRSVQPEQQSRPASRTILVVDDDDGVREILAQALQKCGYEAALARDGMDALRAIETTQFDLVLLDMQMPNRDGIAVLRDLQRRTDAPPIIVMTGNGTTDLREEAMALGARTYLKKPFELRQLLAEVESALIHQPR
ncbi:MAG TPA: response regulator [Candidatus Hydrogenedentes bacterium]|nr:response regulator [Candidatus Hydrogenedentota bacterium]